MAVHPLLNRPAPYSDETLASWLWRLAGRNYIDSPAWFLRYLRDVWPGMVVPWLSSINEPQNEAALTGIAALTGHSIVDLHQHTLHRFSNILTPPGKAVQWGCRISGTALPFFPGHSLNALCSPRFSWCPHCLTVARYVRLHWHLPLVVCCEIHGCWLLKSCPQCHRPITEIDIIRGQCRKCDFELEQVVTPALPTTDPLIQLQSTVMSWVYGQPEHLPLGLPDVPVNALLYVLVGLRYATQRAGNGWAFHHIPPQIPVPNLDMRWPRSLTVFESGCLHATAFRALQDWPRGFFAYLDAYRERPGKNNDETGLRREFGVLHITWFSLRWKHPAFEFIQAAYNDYLVAHMPAYQIIDTNRIIDYPDLLRRIDYLDIFKSACYLGVCTHTIHRLIREQHLTTHRFEQSGGTWLSRKELDQLQQYWEQHITPPEAARSLGVFPKIARELLKAHLLQPVPASEPMKGQQTFLYRDSVPTLIQKLKRHTTIRPDTDQTGVSLAEVCTRNGSIGLRFPQLLDRICAGTLAAYHPDETLFPLTALWFPAEVVANLSDTVKAENEWMNLQETEECLGITRTVLHHFIELGLIRSTVSFGPKKLFSREVVLSLRGRYITSAREAAALLNIPERYISGLVQHGILVPLSGPQVNRNSYYVFERRQLVAWQKKYILHWEMKRVVPDIWLLRRLLKTRSVKPLSKNPLVYLRKKVMPILGSVMLETDQT